MLRRYINSQCKVKKAKEGEVIMKRKVLEVLLISSLAIMLMACGNKTSDEKQKTTNSAEETSDPSPEEADASKSDEEYENVESINIDSGDTRIAYKSSERYTLENGEEVIMVYFDFTNVNADATTLDAQYNFSAFQDGVEVTVYSTIWDEIEAAQNRDKELLSGASMEVAIAIRPNNFESPIKLRVDDNMAYDDAQDSHTLQEQEIPVA